MFLLFGYYHFMLANNFTPLALFLILTTLGWITLPLAREFFYCWLFPDVIAKKKLEYKYKWSDIFGIFNIFFQYYINFCIGIYFGIIHWNYTSFIETYIIEVSFQYWAMTLLKDYVCLKYAHPWMHKMENYWIHLYHHKPREQLMAIHTYSIDSLDVFIENGIAPILFMIVQYILTGKVYVHACAFFFLGWSDTIIHSANPYSICYFNVFFDYFCKPNIEHVLHHVVQEEYYIFNSFNHLFNRKSLDEDLKKYNKIFETKITFDLLI